MSNAQRFPKERSGIAALLLGAVLAAASFIGPAIAITQTGPLLVQDTSDPYAIEGINSSNGGIGVEGYGSFAGKSGVIEPSFASQMAAGQPYRVFLTPEGDSRGLYVVRKTATGFMVRENQGGRSSLSFNYRIVAAVPADDRPKLGSTVARQGSLHQLNPKQIMGQPAAVTLGSEPLRLARPPVPHPHPASRR